MESETEGYTNAYGECKCCDVEEVSGELQARTCHHRGPPPPQTQTCACVLFALLFPPSNASTHPTSLSFPPIFNLPALFLITQNAGEEAACEN